MVGQVVAADAAGNLVIARGMKRMGEIHLRSAGDLFRLLPRLARNPLLGAGVCCMSFAFFSFIRLLSRANLSFVLPATALGYVVNTFGAAFLLKEHVAAGRWMGTLLIGAGVALVALSPAESSLARAETGMTVLALGDSTTAGTPGFRSPVEAPPDGSGNEQSQYTYWAERRSPGRRFLNRGVNGERTDEILRRFKADLQSLHPDAVVVLAGVNDLYQGYPPERIQENLRKIYALASERGIPVMACTIIPYNGMSAEVFSRMRQVNEWIRRNSSETGLGFCDLFGVVEDPERPGFLLHTPDGLHPDVEGYQRMGEAVADALEKWRPAQPAASAATASGFRPAWWCRGAHAQTIWGSILRPTPRVTLKRERWEMPDVDFLDVDRAPGPKGAPTLVVLHGLEGSSRSKQVLGLLAAAQHEGWRGLGMNFRSCSGEPNRQRRSYHGGETSDLAWVIERLVQEEPGSPIFCVGLSLGGNVLLKYLGERGESAPAELRAAAAVSAPFDLARSAHAIEKGFSRTYMRRLVRSLKRKTWEKLERYPDLVDRKAVEAARTLGEFDDAVTAPVHGFRDANAYWAASSSNQFLSKIRRPTLLISAKDDPFLPADALPEEAVAGNRFLTAEFPAHGGHVGFLSGPWPGRPVCWAEKRVVRFLNEHR